MLITRRPSGTGRPRRTPAPGRHRLRKAAAPGRHRLRRAAASAAALLCAGLAPLLGPVTAASAGNLPAPTRVSLGSDTVFSNFAAQDPLITISLPLQANEARVLTGQIVLTSSYVIDTQVGIRCLAPDGTQAGPAEWISRNYNGLSSMTLAPSLLLIAGSEAGTYTCQLLAAADEPTTSTVTMTALASGTWLQADSSADQGAWFWDEPSCDSAGQDPNCVYLGTPSVLPGSQTPAQPVDLPLQTSLIVAQNGASGPSPSEGPSVFTAASNATTIDAGGNIELTTCYSGTASCSSGTPDEQGVYNGTTVTTSLQAIQQTGSGQPCQSTQSTPAQTFVDNNSHHYSLRLSLANIPVSATCGSRKFTINLVVTWDAGNPVKIDGERSNPDESETQAYAFNSTITSAVTVPSVAGEGVGDAERTLATHNLSTGTVTGVISSAPVNSVIAQNAAAQTDEPIGSVVNLTYSEGAVTVPSVTTYSLGSAEGVLSGAGLKYSVTDVSSCVDPGDVMSESPGGGTVVAAGATISLSVAQCSSPPPGGGGSGNPIQPE